MAVLVIGSVGTVADAPGQQSDSRPDTAQHMLAYCKPIANAKVVRGDRIQFPSSFDTGRCWGAFEVLQFMLRAQIVGEKRPVIFWICIPSESNLSQLVTIFVRYVEKHPERLHEDFPRVALDALEEAFPCPAEAGPRG
jgi:hypothetical protein